MNPVQQGKESTEMTLRRGDKTPQNDVQHQQHT